MGCSDGVSQPSIQPFLYSSLSAFSFQLWSPAPACDMLADLPSECIALLQGHTSLVGHTQFRGNRLVTGGSDGRLIIFDLSTYECLHRLCAHDNSITSLQFDERFIVSGGMDGRVKLWDTRTGTFIRELTRPGDAVWRIGCRDDRVIILCQRAGRTVLEVLTFKPGDMVGKRLAL